jgi:hypothetical protein
MEIAFTEGTTIGIFMAVNPSLGTSIPECSSELIPGLAYCAVPYIAWYSNPPTMSPPTYTPQPTSYSTSVLSTGTITASTTSIVSTTSTSSTRTTSSTSPPNPSATNYYGCYTEATGVRALTGFTSVDFVTMTPQKCAEECFVRNFVLFGVEYGGECYCGNSLSIGSIPTFES